MAANLRASVGRTAVAQPGTSGPERGGRRRQRTLELAQALERALKAVLEATGFVAGWVFLFQEDGQRRPPICQQGLPADVAKEGREPVPCLCHRLPWKSNVPDHQPSIGVPGPGRGPGPG